jgi:branched-chain amino acid transport system substrate-binding protein
MTAPGTTSYAIGSAHDRTGGRRACRAFVSPDGSLDECDEPAGVRALQSAPALVTYARALISSGRPAAAFWWRAPDNWLSVWIEVMPDQPSKAEVALLPSELPYDLTSRELDVLTLIAGGMGNPEIARRLFTSPKTVSTHVEHLLRKLGTPTRAGAAAIAADQGIVRLPVPGGGAGLESLTIGMLEAAQPAGATLTRTGARQARRKRPFLLGSAFPLNGPARADGIEMRNGSALAIAEINSRGGIAGRPIDQIVVDTDIFSAAGVQSAFEKLGAADVVACRYGAP